MASKEDKEIACHHEQLDKYVAEFRSANLNRKANELGSPMVTFISKNRSSLISYPGIIDLIEGLGAYWVNSLNNKVSLYGFEALTIILEILQTKYKGYGYSVMPHALNRLGDNKEGLREKSRQFILKTVEIGAQNSNNVLEAVIPLLSSKNKQMAIEAQKVILELLKLCKKKKFIGSLLKELLEAESKCLTQQTMRDDAAEILIDLGTRLGLKRVQDEIEKNKQLSTLAKQKIQYIYDEIAAAAVAAELVGMTITNEDDDVDSISSKAKSVPMATGARPKVKKEMTAPEDKEEDVEAAGVSKVKKVPVATGTKPKVKGSGYGKAPIKSKIFDSTEKFTLYSGPSGDADEAWFLSAFEDITPITVTNHREFEQFTKKLLEDLRTGPETWERKVDAMKKVRSLLIDPIGQEEDVLGFIKLVLLELANIAKDLRSQVVREACLTFAFIAKELKNKIESHGCELVLRVLMSNVMASAKVVASSSYIALKFLFTHVQQRSLLSAINHELTFNKSREIKQAACEFLELITLTWPKTRLEQQIELLEDSIKKGMSEGSPDARFAARRAYWGFYEHFPEAAETLLNSLDAHTKKQVIASQKKPGLTHAKRMPPATTIPRPATFFRAASARQDAPSKFSKQLYSTRSSSEIDVNAAQRAKVRKHYSQMSRQKAGNVSSLPRSAKHPGIILPSVPGSSSSSSSSTYESGRSGRPTSSGSRVSHSTPGSRSGSPSRPPTYLYREELRYYAQRSRASSRDTSPNRGLPREPPNPIYSIKRSRLGLGRDRPPILPSTPVMAQKMLAQSLEAENLPLAGESYDGDGADSLGHKVSPHKTNYRPFEDHSDDSDASSLCSERSFDSYRRTSDSYSWSGSQQRLYRDVWETGAKNIVEIIGNCESIHWSDRKEGLVALQSYLQAGNTLNPSELKRVTDIFTRMFMDNHTKVFSLFLDTLNELILVHRADLNSWLYVLLTRLLNKFGADLLGSIQNKILRSLDVVRDSFPPELQMSSVLRFLTDPTQTPNLRVKTAALTFITKLAAITDPSQAFPPPSPGHTRDPVQAALHKMIGWTMGDSIKQGNELRRASQEAILALFNLNTPQVTLRLASLPQEYQEAAATLLRGRVRRGSSSSGGGTTTNSPPSPSPRLTSPAPTSQRHFSKNQDSDALNPEEIYRSLRKTTAEIQNYTYETGTEKPPDKDNTTSKDSGISQLSGIEALEENMEELSLQSNSASHTNSANANRVLTVRDCNGVDSTDSPPQDDALVDEHESMRKIVEALKSPPDSDNGENISIMSEMEKRATLGQLTRLIRESSVTVLQENFKPLLRILLGNLALDLNTRDVQTRILVLTALTELIKKRAMTEYFNHYVELLILKVLNSYRDTSKEVVRNAESCANTIAMTLAPQMIIRVLAPLIQTGEYPLNLAAIKMLTKLVDCCGRDPVFKYLPDLMPGLIQAYDNHESTVRKSAVFCMVSLHAAIGDEDLKPHLTALNGSKLKLLHLYIRRSQQGSSTPTSPRNHPQNSSS